MNKHWQLFSNFSFGFLFPACCVARVRSLVRLQWPIFLKKNKKTILDKTSRARISDGIVMRNISQNHNVGF